MKQGKMKWRKITLAALTAVLVGGMTGPLGLEAAGLHAGPGLHRTAPAATDGTPAAAPETPEAGTETEPTAKAVARVRVDGVDTEYMDIKEAWAAVNGRTAELTLLDSVTTAAAMNTAFELTGGSVTLDLNGYQWTYQYTSEGETGPATVDLIELRGDASLTIKGGTGSAMVYAGSSNYKGACLYATGSSTLTIEGGTYSSNVSAPVYVDGATLNVKGGVFKAAGAKESAITMNNGTFSMTGGEVQVGTLTLNNTNGEQKVNIGGDSKLSGIVTKGKEALSIEDTLDAESKYQDADSGKTPVVRTEEGQTGETVDNVQAKTAIIKDLKISGNPDLEEIDFSYDGLGKTVILTADYTLNKPENADVSVQYEWKVKDGDGKETNLGVDTETYEFSSKYEEGSQDKIKAGIYTYTVKVTYTIDYQDPAQNTEQIPLNGATEAHYTIKVHPIEDGEVKENSNNNLKKEYIYDEKIELEQDGGIYFDVDSYVPASVKTSLDWDYVWYERTEKGEKGDKLQEEPKNAGKYILEVIAKDEPNYTAVGDFPIDIIPRKVTPEIKKGITKVYDGSEDVNNAEILLIKEDGGTLPCNKDEITIDRIKYDDKNVGKDIKITASGIDLKGEKGQNYNLTKREATTTGSITQASVTLKVEASPSSQNIDNPVTVTVTATDDINNILKKEDIKLSVGSAREDISSRLIDAGNGIFTGQYTPTEVGELKFYAVVNAKNYKSNEATNTPAVNVTRELVKTAVSVKASDSEVTYGDEVTYTATVTKEGGKTGDPLNGGVQFYIDDEKESSNRVGSAQTIKASGDQVKVKLGKSDLTAGDHKIIAVYTPGSTDTIEGAQAEATTKVEKKKLTWNTSGLRASKTAGTSGEAKVYGTLEVDGILDGEVKFEQPESMMTSGLKSAEAGTFKVSVVLEDKEEWKFDPKEPKNYELPEGDPEIRATVNALKELSDPPEAKDGNTYKLVMEEGLSTVPDGLKSTSFNTPVKIEQELKRILTSSGAYTEANTKVYDVTLQVSTDEGKTWTEANANNFPAGGVVVTLPYPGGTGRHTHNFAVAHMFGESLFGHTSGTVEVPNVTKTDNGLRFRVTGLSPIAVSWTDGAGGRVSGTSSSSPSSSSAGSAINRLLGVQTGDDSPILLYIGLAAGCTLLLVILLTVLVVRRKKNTR